MNREREFRLFHEKDGMMYYGDCTVHILLNGDMYHDDGACIPIALKKRKNENSKSGYVLTEYIGLKDKNNKKIFEGDIVNEGENINWEIKWFEDASFGMYNKEFGGEGISTDHCEIIGNKFENPELLN